MTTTTPTATYSIDPTAPADPTEEMTDRDLATEIILAAARQAGDAHRILDHLVEEHDQDPKHVDAEGIAAVAALIDTADITIEWRDHNADPKALVDRPRVVVLCGSTRFRAEMADVNRRETLAGRIVVAPGVFAHDGDTITEAEKANLDALHLCKIDLADEVLVVSDEAGYFGKSTLGEIRYAVANGKPVRFAHPAAEKRWNALTAQSDGGESNG